MIIHLIRLKNVSIFDQLLLEEKLLREDSRNFCILNEGSSPAIVMGISGKPEELISYPKAQELELPIIQRFSGGGTVVVDENTLFVTFLCNKDEFSFPSYPERIMKWTEGFYQKAFSKLPTFRLRENDFVLGDFKCGGNAQYIKKERWLQHTSFLWNFCPEKMSSLLHPRKTPSYREGRNHLDFICKLESHIPSREDFFHWIQKELENQFTLSHLQESDLKDLPQSRIQTRILETSNL